MSRGPVLPPQYRERLRQAIGLPNSKKIASNRRITALVWASIPGGWNGWLEDLVRLGLATVTVDPVSKTVTYHPTASAMRQCLRGRERLPVAWDREGRK